MARVILNEKIYSDDFQKIIGARLRAHRENGTLTGNFCFIKKKIYIHITAAALGDPKLRVSNHRLPGRNAR